MSNIDQEISADAIIAKFDYLQLPKKQKKLLAQKTKEELRK